MTPASNRRTYGTITEPARQIDVIHETDVLVVGSGPAGLAAALGAARTGVEVTLVERFGRYGGGDRISHAATRNMSCCAVLGHGAGVAAALSLHTSRELTDVDITRVQKELDHQGVRHW